MGKKAHKYECPVIGCAEYFETVDSLAGHVAGKARADERHAALRDSDQHNKQWYKENCQYTSVSGDDGKTLKCPECGSHAVFRQVSSGSGSNRTANRLVGGRNMDVVRKCADCEHVVGGIGGGTG